MPLADTTTTGTTTTTTGTTTTGTTTVGTTTTHDHDDHDDDRARHDPDAATAARGRHRRRRPGRQPARRRGRERRFAPYFSTPLEAPSRQAGLHRRPEHARDAEDHEGASQRAQKARPFANLRPRRRRARRSRCGRSSRRSRRRSTKPPVDSRLILRNLKPYLTPERPGVALAQPATVKAIAKALRLNARGCDRSCRRRRRRREVTRKSFGPVIVIHRGSNRLYLYQRRAAKPDLPGRDRTERVPDAARQLPDRRHVAEPVVVPAELGRGRRASSRFRPARTTRSARAGWASPRPASASTARTTTRRSATRSRTAASACT